MQRRSKDAMRVLLIHYPQRIPGMLALTVLPQLSECSVGQNVELLHDLGISLAQLRLVAPSEKSPLLN